tara:strand:+ start:498 stop:626 length:129 start_codon:yes stop_codon:yes gene_type:complete
MISNFAVIGAHNALIHEPKCDGVAFVTTKGMTAHFGLCATDC